MFLRIALKIVLSGKYKWKYIWSQNEETFSKHMTKSKKIDDLHYVKLRMFVHPKDPLREGIENPQNGRRYI